MLKSVTNHNYLNIIKLVISPQNGITLYTVIAPIHAANIFYKPITFTLHIRVFLIVKILLNSNYKISKIYKTKHFYDYAITSMKCNYSLYFNSYDILEKKTVHHIPVYKWRRDKLSKLDFQVLFLLLKLLEMAYKTT